MRKKTSAVFLTSVPKLRKVEMAAHKCPSCDNTTVVQASIDTPFCVHCGHDDLIPRTMASAKGKRLLQANDSELAAVKCPGCSVSMVMKIDTAHAHVEDGDDAGHIHCAACGSGVAYDAPEENANLRKKLNALRKEFLREVKAMPRRAFFKWSALVAEDLGFIDDLPDTPEGFVEALFEADPLEDVFSVVSELVDVDTASTDISEARKRFIKMAGKSLAPYWDTVMDTSKPMKARQDALRKLNDEFAGDNAPVSASDVEGFREIELSSSTSDELEGTNRIPDPAMPIPQVHDEVDKAERKRHLVKIADVLGIEEEHAGSSCNFHAAGSKVYAVVDDQVIAKKECGEADDPVALAQALQVASQSNPLKEVLAGNGFEYSELEIEADAGVAAEVQRQIEAKLTALEQARSELAAGMKQSLSIAAAGMTRGFFKDRKNAIKSALVAQLVEREMDREVAEYAVSTAFAESSDDYHQALLEVAQELLSKPADVRNELATTIMDVVPEAPKATPTPDKDDQVTASLVNPIKAPAKVGVRQKAVATIDAGGSRVAALAKSSSLLSR